MVKKIRIELSRFAGLYLNIARELDELSRFSPVVDVDNQMVSFLYKDRRVVFNRLDDSQFLSSLSMITESFVGQEYKELNVKDKVVVDIGAYMGETAILFVLNGAKHVYAFEPYPYAYKIAKSNVEANNLQDKITLLNKGCGEEKTVKVDENFRNKMYSELRSFDKGKPVKVMSLDKIVKSYDIESGSKLKLDCEGCEYAIILNSSPETLTKFDQIVMEYHYHFGKLVNRLRKLSYDVKQISPKRYFQNPEATNKNMYMGVIFAELKQKIP